MYTIPRRRSARSCWPGRASGAGCWTGPSRKALSSKQRDPNPSKSSLVRKQCCRPRTEPLVCICFLSYQGIILRVRVPLFASEPREFREPAC